MTDAPIAAREATRSDYPRTYKKETQCPICWRMFTSDSACESHKPYAKPKTAECKDPESIGMEFIERNGLKMWRVPMTEEQLERLRNRAAESAAADAPSIV